jgi:hypothetical protein
MSTVTTGGDDVGRRQHLRERQLASTSFTITSADVTDTSVAAWELKEPAS